MLVQRVESEQRGYISDDKTAVESTHVHDAIKSHAVHRGT